MRKWRNKRQKRNGWHFCRSEICQSKIQASRQSVCVQSAFHVAKSSPEVLVPLNASSHAPSRPKAKAAKPHLQDYPLPLISWRFWNILKHPQNMIHVSSLDIQKRCLASGSHVEHMLIERWVQTKLCNYAEKIMESGFQPYPSNPKSLKSWLDNQSIMFRPPS